jgi:hypothetical protein
MRRTGEHKTERWVNMVQNLQIFNPSFKLICFANYVQHSFYVYLLLIYVCPR